MAFDPTSALGSWLFGQLLDKTAEETGLKDRGNKIVNTLLDAIAPPAAASDLRSLPASAVGSPVLPENKLLPADVTLSPDQEQMVMNRIATEPPARPRVSGRTYLPDIVMESPEVEANQKRDEVQDFVRSVSGRTKALLEEVPKGDPKGAMALAAVEGLAAKGMQDDEPLDLGAPVSDAKDVKYGLYPNGKDAEPSFFDRAGTFFGDLFGNEERMARMALAFNSMRLQPDQNLAAVLGKRIESLSTQRDRQRSALATSGNQTLKLMDEYPSIKSAYLSGQMDLKDALSAIKDMRRLAIDEGEPAAFRALKMRAKAAGLQEGTPEYNQFMINGGQRKGMSIRVAPDGTVEMVEGGDLSSMTEAQTNALTFSQRMKASNLILDEVEQEGTSLYQHIVNKVPLISGYLTSDEYKSYDQAKRDFINATLRKESGAAIAQSEFDNAEKQYFPVAGDSQQVIAQKKANRVLAQQLIEAGIPDVNKRVANMNIRGGVETLEQQSKVQTEKPQITPQQAAEELRRRRGQ